MNWSDYRSKGGHLYVAMREYELVVVYFIEKPDSKVIDSVINYLKSLKSSTPELPGIISECYLIKIDFKNAYSIINNISDGNIEKVYSYINIHKAWQAKKKGK